MRHAGLLTFDWSRLSGVILAGAMVFAGVGCHQHYYYYGDACAPIAPVPSTVRTGPVCDVPAQSVEGGTKLSSGSNALDHRQRRFSQQFIQSGRQRTQRAVTRFLAQIRSGRQLGDDQCARIDQRLVGQPLTPTCYGR